MDIMSRNRTQPPLPAVALKARTSCFNKWSHLSCHAQHTGEHGTIESRPKIDPVPRQLKASTTPQQPTGTFASVGSSCSIRIRALTVMIVKTIFLRQPIRTSTYSTPAGYLLFTSVGVINSPLPMGTQSDYQTIISRSPTCLGPWRVLQQQVGLRVRKENSAGKRFDAHL